MTNDTVSHLVAGRPRPPWTPPRFRGQLRAFPNFILPGRIDRMRLLWYKVAIIGLIARRSRGWAMSFSHVQAARICYAAIRQLREEQGCCRGPVWNLLPQAEQSWYAQAVARARRGWMPRQVHEAWRAELEEAGWRPGPEIDHCFKTHPELIPWDDLDGKYRLRFVLLQMNATALTIGVPLLWDIPEAVTPP